MSWITVELIANHVSLKLSMLVSLSPLGSRGYSFTAWVALAYLVAVAVPVSWSSPEWSCGEAVTGM